MTQRPRTNVYTARALLRSKTTVKEGEVERGEEVEGEVAGKVVLGEATNEVEVVGEELILVTPFHYGTKSGHFETLKIHFPTSEGVSEVSERANE